jgi:hypothetical protein
MKYYVRRVRRVSERRRQKSLENQIWASIFMLYAIIMGPFGYFLIANDTAIAYHTHDHVQLIGQLGVIGMVSAFLALLIIPLCFLD